MGGHVVTGAALRVEHLSKTYPGTRALVDVSFAVARGRVHGLIGGNGSGKSTLIKVLAGVCPPDPDSAVVLGDQRVDGAELNPARARELGLRFVHQATSTFDDLTVAENLAMGDAWPTRRGAIDWPALRGSADALIERFGIAARSTDELRDLRAADRTMIAIARALKDGDGASVLILDEPTASLPAHEVDVLLRALRGYAAAGQTILYVSHRLAEITSLTTTVTVLRDGRAVTTRPTAELDEAAMVELMVGGRLSPAAGARTDRVQRSAPILSVSHAGAGAAVVDVSLDVHAGEIVGVAGLLGSGRTELLETLFGHRRLTGGRMTLDGKPYAPRRPQDALARGVTFVPENRARDGAFLDLSVSDNVAMASLRRFHRRGRRRPAEERAAARDAIARYAIRTPDETVPLTSLSGGNQQKAVLARSLLRDPRLLLLDEPTQGIDAAARQDIYRTIRDRADRGTAAVVVSSDIEELVRECDRIVVLRGGHTVAEVERADFDVHHVTALAATDQPAWENA